MANPLHTITGVALQASLDGLSKKFKTLFDIPVVKSATNNQKRVVELINGGKPANLPYGWFKPSSIDLDTSRGNPKSIARYGSGHVVQEQTSTLKKSHLFPCSVPLDCTVRFDDYNEACIFAEKFVLALSGDLFNFELHLGGDKWTVGLNSEGSFSVPLPTLDDIDNADGTYYEIQLSLKLQTKVGFMLDVAKLNNEGSVTLRNTV